MPGEPWQEALEDAIAASRTCAVFVGREIGPWQNEEMRAALNDRVRNAGFRVIPVLLPGAPEPGDHDLPRFLRRLAWVDLRRGPDDDDAYHQLVCGIRGVPPGAAAGAAASAGPYRAKLPPNDFTPHAPERSRSSPSDLAESETSVAITTALRGAGGFGKTALARALGHRLAPPRRRATRGRCRRRCASQPTCCRGTGVPSGRPTTPTTCRTCCPRAGQAQRSLRPLAAVFAVAVLDETRVVSASRDRTLRVWDVESGETVLADGFESGGTSAWSGGS